MDIGQGRSYIISPSVLKLKYPLPIESLYVLLKVGFGLGVFYVIYSMQVHIGPVSDTAQGEAKCCITQ